MESGSHSENILPSAPPPTDKQTIIDIHQEIFDRNCQFENQAQETAFFYSVAEHWGTFTLDEQDKQLLSLIPIEKHLLMLGNFIGFTKESLISFIKNIAPKPDSKSIELYRFFASLPHVKGIFHTCCGVGFENIKNFADILNLFHPSLRTRVLFEFYLHPEIGITLTDSVQARALAPTLPPSAYNQFCALNPPFEICEPWFIEKETPMYAQAIMHSFLPEDWSTQITTKHDDLLANSQRQSMLSTNKIDEVKTKKAIYLSQVLASIENILSGEIPDATTLEELRGNIWQRCFILSSDPEFHSQNPQFHGATVRDRDKSKVIASETKTIVDSLFNTLGQIEQQFTLGSEYHKSSHITSCSSNFSFAGPAPAAPNPHAAGSHHYLEI